VYNSFKSSVLGKVIGDGECVALVRAYITDLFPDVDSYTVMPQVDSAYQLADKSNSYITWVVNDHSDAGQLPSQGDIMVFGPTPEPGYTNTFNNPDGHCGVCDSASPTEYVLLAQNSPNTGDPANVTSFPWKYRPCSGWYTINGGTPIPPPSGQTIFLPPTTGPWHLYNVGGPYNPAVPADVKGLLKPSEFGGLTYSIVADRGNGVYTIDTEDFGQGDIWTNGSSVVIS
jgi:hypothetical protein